MKYHRKQKNMIENSVKSRTAATQPEFYEIHVHGILAQEWSDWLECTNLEYIKSETILICEIQDQAALHGLLVKIRDMNLKILSIVRVGSRTNIEDG